MSFTADRLLYPLADHYSRYDYGIIYRSAVDTLCTVMYHASVISQGSSISLRTLPQLTSSQRREGIADFTIMFVFLADHTATQYDRLLA